MIPKRRNPWPAHRGPITTAEHECNRRLGLAEIQEREARRRRRDDSDRGFRMTPALRRRLPAFAASLARSEGMPAAKPRGDMLESYCQYPTEEGWVRKWLCINLNLGSAFLKTTETDCDGRTDDAYSADWAWWRSPSLGRAESWSLSKLSHRDHSAEAMGY